MRESPSLEIVAALQKAGAFIRAYDPEGMEEAKSMLTDVEWCSDAYTAMEDADAVSIITEWNQVRAIDHERIRLRLKSPVMIDFRNIYQPDEMAAAGFVYESIGRNSLA